MWAWPWNRYHAHSRRDADEVGSVGTHDLWEPESQAHWNTICFSRDAKISVACTCVIAYRVDWLRLLASLMLHHCCQWVWSSHCYHAMSSGVEVLVWSVVKLLMNVWMYSLYIYIYIISYVKVCMCRQCVGMFVDTHARVHVSRHTCKYCTSIFEYICLYANWQLYLHVHVCMDICTFAHIPACACMHEHAHLQTYTHADINIHLLWPMRLIHVCIHMSHTFVHTWWTHSNFLVCIKAQNTILYIHTYIHTYDLRLNHATFSQAFLFLELILFMIQSHFCYNFPVLLKHVLPDVEVQPLVGDFLEQLVCMYVSHMCLWQIVYIKVWVLTLKSSFISNSLQKQQFVRILLFMFTFCSSFLWVVFKNSSVMYVCVYAGVCLCLCMLTYYLASKPGFPWAISKSSHVWISCIYIKCTHVHVYNAGIHCSTAEAPRGSNVLRNTCIRACLQTYAHT